MKDESRTFASGAPRGNSNEDPLIQHNQHHGAEWRDAKGAWGVFGRTGLWLTVKSDHLPCRDGVTVALLYVLYSRSAEKLS